MTDVAARIAAASGDASALLALAIELANENARLAGHAAALEEAEAVRKAAQAERKRRQRHGTSRDVTGQSVTERDVTTESSGETPRSLLPPGPPNNSFPPRSKAKATTPRAASPSAPRAEPAFDLAPYLDAHSARFPGSLAPAARLGKTLKAVEREHGPAETLRRWQIFLAAKGELGPEYFARTWSEWGGGPKLNGHAPNGDGAEAAWTAVVDLIPAWQRREITAEAHKNLSPAIRRGLSAIGGFMAIQNAPADKRTWLKRDFLAAYRNASTEQAHV